MKVQVATKPILRAVALTIRGVASIAMGLATGGLAALITWFLASGIQGQIAPNDAPGSTIGFPEIASLIIGVSFGLLGLLIGWNKADEVWDALSRADLNL